MTTLKENPRMVMQSVFGMFEMECAAAILLAKCLEKGTWLWGTTIFDMGEDLEKNGFIWLVHYRWICPGYHKAPFYATQAFIDRLIEKKVDIGNLPRTAPTTEEIVNHQVPIS